MAAYQFEYGDKVFSLEIEQGNILGSIEAREIPPLDDLEGTLRHLLNHPLSSPPLKEVVKKSDRVVILAGDMTRLWVGTANFLPVLLEELLAVGLERSQITILLGTGDHRPHTDEEKRQIVGEEVFENFEVVEHRARERGDLVHLGETSRGTPIWVNRRVMEADKVILTGGIVYHFLAGFGGGPKALSVGTAGYDTIQNNHKIALGSKEEGLNPKVSSGVTWGNPLYEDLVEIMKAAKADFLVDTVINREKEIAAIVAGDPIEAHHAGIEKVQEFYGIETNLKGDLVIASAMGYPEDINFYQVYKTLDNVTRVVKPGGVIVLFAECREGMGNDDFARIFSDFTDNDTRYADLSANCTIGGLMGFGIALWAARHKIVLYSDMPPELAKTAGVIPASTPEEALAKGFELAVENPDVVIMPHGSVTFPILS
ncbi:MAG: nickel-dependent lactate racemase [Deltaproteobacteria bacterium]|nr:nickel-dependent lactate racemase [Deltaproteobacteria bacterium]